MAANSSVLHYAAGIPVAGCQLRRSLVKTTIKASNIPSMPSETSAFGLVSKPLPPQLQRNSVCTRRNKTIVAAYPDLKIEVTTIITPGVPEYTAIEFQNISCQTIKLDDKYFWAGAQEPKIPKEIEGWHVGRFEHRAGSDGSIGAVEYVFPGDAYKLIVAWSNAKDDLNKVYFLSYPHNINNLLTFMDVHLQL